MGLERQDCSRPLVHVRSLLRTTRDRLSKIPSKVQRVPSHCYLRAGYPSRDGGKKRIFKKQHNTCRFLVLNCWGVHTNQSTIQQSQSKAACSTPTCAFHLIGQHVGFAGVSGRRDGQPGPARLSSPRAAAPDATTGSRGRPSSCVRRGSFRTRVRPRRDCAASAAAGRGSSHAASSRSRRPS